MQGDFVVLAAEPLCICGIDVAAPPKARQSRIQDINDIKKNFTKQLTSAEVCDAAVAIFSENLNLVHGSASILAGLTMLVGTRQTKC